MIKSVCLKCKKRHDYHKRKLKKNEAWCLVFFKMIKNKRNCEKLEPKEQNDN